MVHDRDTIRSFGYQGKIVAYQEEGKAAPVIQVF
jgi:hypothetical protein